MGHFEYEIYDIKTKKLIAKGDGHVCAEAIGKPYDYFRKTLGKNIVDGISTKYYGNRVWVDDASKSICTLEYCSKCKFFSKADGWNMCLYILDMDTKRPCKAGPGCTVRKFGKRPAGKNRLGSLTRNENWDYWREWRKRG